MDKLNYIDSNGNIMNISVIGFFSIPDLEKEYVIYSMVDNNSANEDGYILLGEVLREENSIQILGILSEERDLVVAYYNEISNHLGGGFDE